MRKLKVKTYTILFDDEDYKLISKYKWYLHKKSDKLIYAVGYRMVKPKVRQLVRMNRLLLNPKKGEIVDHINHNGLDNRKCNLRICNDQQNRGNSRLYFTNTSGYKGVSSHRNKWRAKIGMEGKYIGLFKTPIEAAKAYNKVALKKYGKFAELNKLT